MHEDENHFTNEIYFYVSKSLLNLLLCQYFDILVSNHNKDEMYFSLCKKV